MPIPELAESKVPHRWRSLSGSETARKILLEVTVQNFRLFGLFVDLNCVELGWLVIGVRKPHMSWKPRSMHAHGSQENSTDTSQNNFLGCMLLQMRDALGPPRRRNGWPRNLLEQGSLKYLPVVQQTIRKNKSGFHSFTSLFMFLWKCYPMSYFTLSLC
jgi:hypothetical protein